MQRLTGFLIVLAMLAIPALGQSANVFVVHGIPGQDLNAPAPLPVDVAVNSQCTLQGFTFGSVAGPLSLAPGNYSVAISAANTQNPCSNPPLISATVPISAGEDVVIIAHLDANGNATASKFTFDNSRAGHFNGRLVLHHTANAPAVDLRLQSFFFGARRSFNGVTNGGQASIVLPYDFYSLGVFPAGSQMPVLPTLQAPLFPEYTYLVFVVGSLRNNTLQPLFLIRRNR